jgi:SAM-dependent methyltransferase
LNEDVTTPDYVLGSDDVEIARLQAQAAIRDVAFQVAELVGPDGSVLGVEQDPAQIAVAGQRRDQLGLTNVEFRQGDARTFVADEPFDAAVCRLLLMHLPDAVDVLAHQMGNLRRGGVFVAIDYDMGGVRALPQVDLYTRVGAWVAAGFAQAKADPFVGMRLPVYFQQAGYADVDSLGLQSYWAPTDARAAAYVVGVVRAMKPAILAAGVTTEEEMELDTLAQRLAEAIRAANAVYTVPTVVGAWGRRP